MQPCASSAWTVAGSHAPRSTSSRATAWPMLPPNRCIRSSRLNWKSAAHTHQPKTQDLHKTGHPHTHDHEHSHAEHETHEHDHAHSHDEHSHSHNDHSHDHEHHAHGRSLTAIRRLIQDAALPEPVKQTAIRAFEPARPLRGKDPQHPGRGDSLPRGGRGGCNRGHCRSQRRNSSPQHRRMVLLAHQRGRRNRGLCSWDLPRARACHGRPAAWSSHLLGPSPAGAS